ncbi:MAG: hypothetical protein A2Y14_01750 [Verrucomicrobia bacterium GWF2_51_19]|nr:MAG: hypothetical protein A2Y14_01750 [Verrucomicrobia bacterium GWF2_51_19]HCJ12020.1 hypothetical protein [Opitutae bacterium]
MKEKIIVLCGGIGEESQVSLTSGHCVEEALKDDYEVQLIELTENKLPSYLNPSDGLIFPAMHGDFGEDGQLQAILESKGFHFAGSGSKASRICMHKPSAKQMCRDAGFATLNDIVFTETNKPTTQQVIKTLGSKVILKPSNKGSSVGVQALHNEQEISQALSNTFTNEWMFEPLLKGREIAIAVVGDESMGLLQIVPPGEIFDYFEKYNKSSATQYLYPAPVSDSLRDQMRFAASEIFTLLGCRDFARVDFMLDKNDRFFFMETNSIPGLRPTSLFSKSAMAAGSNFRQALDGVLSSCRERTLVFI